MESWKTLWQYAIGTDILRGQIDLESWKTLTKNVRTTRYKMYDLKNEEINLDFNTS